MAVIGSGHRRARLSPDDVGLQLLENSLVTGAALVALILALQPVSAAFNPVVTLVERVLGPDHAPARPPCPSAAQVAGGVVGVVLANLMFDLDAVSVSTTTAAAAGSGSARSSPPSAWCWSSSASVRAGRIDTVAYAVGGYITAAYWFTSSTSFANPAVTIARTLSDTFAGIAPASVPVFVLMQLVGRRGSGLGLVRCSTPRRPREVTARMTDRTRAVRLRPQRRPVPDGRRLPPAPGRRPDRRPLRRLRSPRDQVNPVAVEAMAEEGIDITGRAAQAAHRRRRAGRRRRDHHGLRRRLPVLPRQALRGLGARRPGRPGHRRRSARSATRSGGASRP